MILAATNHMEFTATEVQDDFVYSLRFRLIESSEFGELVHAVPKAPGEDIKTHQDEAESWLWFNMIQGIVKKWAPDTVGNCGACGGIYLMFTSAKCSCCEEE